MGCNQSKAATTKSSEPVAPQKEQQQTAEVVAIAAAVSVAAPAPEVKQQAEPAAAPATVEASFEQPAAAAEEPVVVAEVAVEKQCDAPEADVPVTPAIVAPVVATTPMTPVKKSSKAAKKQQKQQQQQQPAATPVVEAFSRTAPVAFVGEQENSAVSPKRSALKVAGATPGRTSTGFGLSTKANGNVMSPVRACDADAEKKAVHFAAEPAKQQHQDKVTQIVNKLKKGKGARNGLNKGNVRDEVLLAQISAFERLLTDASTLTRQLDSR